MRDPYDERYKAVNQVWDDRGFKAYLSFTDHPISVSLLALVACVAVIAAIAFGGQSLGFWLQDRSQSHQVMLLRQQAKQLQASPSAQQGDLQNINDKLQNILELNLANPKEPALQFQLTQELCQSASQLNPGANLPPATKAFVSAHCIGGSANPGNTKF